MSAIDYLSKIKQNLSKGAAEIEEMDESDPLLRDTILGAAGTGAATGGLYLANKWKPSKTIVVSGGHIKDHGIASDHWLRDKPFLRKWVWGKTPMHRMHIADTGAGHLTPAEAIREALEAHPDVGYTKDKKWLLDTAFRGGRYGDHNLPYTTAGKNERAFGVIDSGFGALSTGLPYGMKLNEPEFKVNPFGKLFVETDPVAKVPNISAIHGVQGLTGAESYRDTNIATFGGKRAKSLSKIDPDIDFYGEAGATGPTKVIKKVMDRLFGKYKPVLHASDTVSPYISNATYDTAQDLVDAMGGVRRDAAGKVVSQTGKAAITQHDVLRQIAEQHPEYAHLVEDAIKNNKKIALITGSSRGDVVAQKTQDLLERLGKSGRNDVQIISVLGERLTPSVQQLVKNPSLSPEVRDIADKYLAANPGANLADLEGLFPKGSIQQKSIRKLLDIPRSDKLITDPSVIKLPGVYSNLGLDAENKLVSAASPQAKKKIKTFLAMQSLFPHWASTGMNSANEVMMLPGHHAFPGNIGEMKLREIANLLKQKLITKEQALTLKNIKVEQWNEGTLNLVRDKLSKTHPGIHYVNSADDFLRVIDAAHGTNPLAKRHNINRAQQVINESKAAKKVWAEEYINWLNKRHDLAKKWLGRAKMVGYGGLGLAGIFGTKALIEAAHRLKENKPRMRKQPSLYDRTKKRLAPVEDLEKTSSTRAARMLMELAEKEKTPEVLKTISKIKAGLRRGATSKDAVDPLTHRAIKKILSNYKDPATRDAIARNQQTEYKLIREAMLKLKGQGRSTSEALKEIGKNPELAGWGASTRLIEKAPGPKEQFSRRGFEGDAMWGFNPEHGDVVIKKTHHHPDTTKYRGDKAIPVKPGLTPKDIGKYPGELKPFAMSSGAPIQEKIDVMRKYPNIMAGVIAPTNVGYVMPKLTPIDDLKKDTKKLKPILNDFIDRLWEDMHPYDKMIRSKKEIYEQIVEGNPKDKWNGRYRKIFGNRTPITLADGTAIEDYHLGNLLMDDKGKLVIADPQLSHRGSTLGRHVATAGLGLGGLGAAALGARGVKHVMDGDAPHPDKVDLGLGAAAVAGGTGALLSKHLGWVKNRLTPMRGPGFAAGIGVAGAALGALGLKNILARKTQNGQLPQE